MVVRANYDTFGCGQTFCKLPLEVRRLSVHYKKKKAQRAGGEATRLRPHNLP